MLIYLPIVLFVLAFLYETYLSFMRLKSPKAGKGGYVAATWEVTHTLLIFAVVMMLMLFTGSIDKLGSAIYVATFTAAVFLGLRSVGYLYIFYVRSTRTTNWIDWVFAFSHVGAAISLVIVVLQASWFLVVHQPAANLEFIPAFLPGLILVLAVGALPMLTLYKSK
ncbi:hypothetical protein KBD87_02090 [Candidatus Saccharibacteria bacterium]|nr:hypothetical protein [Candidatus Saccharibacteria bacterium]